MKRLIQVGVLAALVAAFALAPAPRVADAAVGICNPQQSLLCSGLMEWWNFEEATNSTRFGEASNAPLYENQGGNVDQSATHMIGSYSASGFATNSAQLRIPRFGSLPSYFTLAAWIRLTTGGGTAVVVSTMDGGVSDINGVVLQLNTANKPEFWAYENETDTPQPYTHGTALSTNTWYLVVWKVSPYGPYGKAQACISVTASGTGTPNAFTCGDLTYNVRGGSGDLTIGGRGTQYFPGQIDGLGIWARAWSPSDLAAYNNSGSGIAFPFY